MDPRDQILELSRVVSLAIFDEEAGFKVQKSRELNPALDMGCGTFTKPNACPEFLFKIMYFKLLFSAEA